jgi:hypothetical protein
MIKKFGTRLNVLEKQYSPKKKGLLLIARDENETSQEAFDRSGNLGRREDYKILFVVGVSVKR